MHPALRKGPLLYKTPPFSTFYKKHPHISFPAYGHGLGWRNTSSRDAIRFSEHRARRRVYRQLAVWGGLRPLFNHRYSAGDGSVIVGNEIMNELP